MDRLVATSGRGPSADWTIYGLQQDALPTPTSVVLTIREVLVSHIHNTAEQTSHETTGHRTSST